MIIAFDSKRAFFNNAGLGNYSRNTIRLLCSYYPGNEYLLYTPSFPGKVDFKPQGNVKILTPSTFTGKVFKPAWRSYLINSQLVKDKPDIYHGLSNEIPYGINATKVKAVVTIHDLIFLRYPSLYKKTDRKIYDKKFRYAALNARKVIAVSRQTAEDIVNYYNIDKERITVVYQSCNPAFYQIVTDEQKNSIRKKYNLPQSYVLYVGTIEKRKNLLGIIKALNENKIDIPLVAVGRKTEYFKEIQNYISGKEVSGRILFIDNLANSELPAFYQMADVFVYPSFFEGFGIPILEALASGTPVITSKGGCFGEAAGENSLFVNPEDTDALGYSIKNILEDNTLSERMIQEGRKYALNFTEEKVALNLMKVYEEIV